MSRTVMTINGSLIYGGWQDSEETSYNMVNIFGGSHVAYPTIYTIF